MSTETYSEAVDVAPVKRVARKGAGRRPAPNPFIDSVRLVIGNGATKGRGFSLDAERGETLKQRHGRVRRALTAAGVEIANEQGRGEPYRIGMAIEPNAEGSGVSGDYIVKFWDKTSY